MGGGGGATVDGKVKNVHKCPLPTKHMVIRSISLHVLITSITTPRSIIGLSSTFCQFRFE